MRLVTNFFNNVASLLDKTYFPDVKYYMDNENCAKVHHTLENFNNGVLTYTKLISKLAKVCNDSKANIHNHVKNYIIFDNENYLKIINKKFGN